MNYAIIYQGNVVSLSEEAKKIAKCLSVGNNVKIAEIGTFFTPNPTLTYPLKFNVFDRIIYFCVTAVTAIEYMNFYTSKYITKDIILYTVIEGTPKTLSERHVRYVNLFKVIAPSNFVKEILTDYGIKVDDVIYHGIDTKEYPSAEKVVAYRNRFPNRKIICSVGGYVKRKGYENFIKAVDILKDKINMKFVVNIHTSDLFPLHIIPEHLKNYIVVDKTFSLGTLKEDVLAKIMGCDIFAYPSLSEGFGIPCLEAMYFKKPIVYNNAPAHNEYAVGFKVEPTTVMYEDFAGIVDVKEYCYEPNDFAEMLKYALENEKECREISMKAHEKSLQFDINRVYKKFENI
jgi:glycosyltransferase involved in cell wall biosynthesis